MAAADSDIATDARLRQEFDQNGFVVIRGLRTAAETHAELWPLVTDERLTTRLPAFTYVARHFK